MPATGFLRTKWLGQPPELWVGAIAFFALQTSLLPIAIGSGISGGAQIALGLLPLLALLLFARGVFRIVRDRDYFRQPPELWLGAIAFVVLQISVLPVALSVELPGGARIAVGLLPLCALLLVARGLYRIIRDQDELYRRIRFEAVAYAAGAVMLLSFVLATLEQLEVIEPVGPAWAGLTLIFAWVIAAAILNRRYR
jgi:hypothetical protein